MLTPARHLIPPRYVYTHSLTCMSCRTSLMRTYEIDYCYLCHFIEESFNQFINQFHLCSKHDIFRKHSTFHSHENASVPQFSTASCTSRCHTLKIKFLLCIWAENLSKNMVSVATLCCETIYINQVMWNTRLVEEMCKETTKTAPLRVVVKYCWSVHIFAARILKREMSNS
jgi:hypothetical protein